MATPISNKLHLFATPLMRGDDFVLCVHGDSQTADCCLTDGGSPAIAVHSYCNYIFGIIQSWKPPAWSGLMLKSAYIAGGVRESHTAFGADSSSNCTLRVTSPGKTSSIGPVAPAPKQTRDFVFTGAVADGANYSYCDWSSGSRSVTFTSNTTGSTETTLAGLSGNHRAHTGMTVVITNHDDAALNNMTCRISCPPTPFTSIRVNTISAVAASDVSFTGTFPSQWASGDWFSSVHMAGRVVLFKSTTHSMLTSFSTQPRRNGAGVAGSTAGRTAADEDGIAWFDQAIGNAAGYPGVGLLSSGGLAETGLNLMVVGYSIYKHDGSLNRSAGLYIYDVGQTGMTSMGLAGALGSSLGTLDTNVSQTAINKWNEANFDARYHLVRIGYNAISSGDYDEVNGGTASGASGGFADGSYAQYKYNVQQIINQINTNHAARGLAGLPIILLVAQYQAGSDTYASLRATALYELSNDNQNVCFFNEYAAAGSSMLSPGIANWWTDDGIHPSAAGSGYIAGLLWSALKNEYLLYDPYRNNRMHRLVR